MLNSLWRYYFFKATIETILLCFFIETEVLPCMSFATLIQCFALFISLVSAAISAFQNVVRDCIACKA